MDICTCLSCDQPYTRRNYHSKTLCEPCVSLRATERNDARRAGTMAEFRAKWHAPPAEFAPAASLVFEELYGPAYRELSRFYRRDGRLLARPKPAPKTT